MRVINSLRLHLDAKPICQHKLHRYRLLPECIELIKQTERLIPNLKRSRVALVY